MDDVDLGGLGILCVLGNGIIMSLVMQSVWPVICSIAAVYIVGSLLKR